MTPRFAPRMQRFSRATPANKTHRVPLGVLALVVAAATALSGCAAGSAAKQGRSFARSENWDQAVYYYSKALAMSPENIEYRKALEYAKVEASQQHAEAAKSFMAAGALELAIAEYRVAASLDPTNRFVSDSLENAVERKRELETKTEDKSDLEQMKEDARASGVPAVLQPASDTPLTLNFPLNTKVKDIYTALGKASGINFLFDSGIRDQDTFAIDIANISFKRALDQVAIANKHFYKIIDEHTLMVIPDNPAKRRDYEDNVIKTFYLSNAAPNDVVNTLRGLLDARRLAVNVQLNAITIRDTPSKLSVMERIIEANDKPPSEVVIDVEIVEVQKADTMTLGTGLSEYRVNEVLEQNDEVNGVKGLRLSSLPYINSSNWLLTFPSLSYEAKKGSGRIRSLARPSLRVLDGKQVTLRLGDQVPIETSTFTATSGGNTPLTRNFQFRDIGTNIDITPRVHHNNEVTLQLQVELTSIGEDPDGAAGPIPPTFGNRRINTEIRLKDGETNLLAGLFTSSLSSGSEGLPILSDIPILKTFFTKNARNSRETDIVLTLTPHIVRTPNIRKGDLEAFYVGTEANVGGVGDVGLGGAFAGATPFNAGAEGEAQPATTTPPGTRPTPPRPNVPGRGNTGFNPTPPGQALPVFPEGAPQLRPGAPPLPNQGARPLNEGSGDDQAPNQGAAQPERGTTGPASGVTSGILPDPVSPNGLAATSGSDSEPGGTTRGGRARLAGEATETAPASFGPDGGGGAAASGAIVPVVLLAPSSTIVTAGQEVAVEARISDAEGVGHVPFWVVWDPAVLEYIQATEGDFMRANGAPTEFFASVRSAGQVAVGVSRLGRAEGARGAGVIVAFRFRALASGRTTVGFESASLRNSSGSTVPASFESTTISVP